MFEQLHHDLRAFMEACRTRPSSHAVHSLRTSTRRMEALLRNLLEEHPQTPHLRGRVHHVLDALRELRRGAGRIRDLDVQRMLIAEIAARRTDMGSIKKREAWDEQCAELGIVLRRRRKRESAKIMSLLQDAVPPLERALNRMAETIKTVDEAHPLKIDLLNCLRSSLALTDTSEESLHRYRKRIKAARYLLEMRDGSPVARRFVTQLKQVLDPIGRWHDLLLLTEEATALLGKKVILTETIRAERDEALLLAIKAAESMNSPKHNQSLDSTPLS